MDLQKKNFPVVITGAVFEAQKHFLLCNKQRQSSKGNDSERQ